MNLIAAAFIVDLYVVIKMRPYDWIPSPYMDDENEKTNENVFNGELMNARMNV